MLYGPLSNNRNVDEATKGCAGYYQEVFIKYLRKHREFESGCYPSAKGALTEFNVYYQNEVLKFRLGLRSALTQAEIDEHVRDRLAPEFALNHLWLAGPQGDKALYANLTRRKSMIGKMTEAGTAPLVEGVGKALCRYIDRHKKAQDGYFHEAIKGLAKFNAFIETQGALAKHNLRATFYKHELRTFVCEEIMPKI